MSIGQPGKHGLRRDAEQPRPIWSARSQKTVESNGSGEHLKPRDLARTGKIGPGPVHFGSNDQRRTDSRALFCLA
jgi:hypothetical protein